MAKKGKRGRSTLGVLLHQVIVVVGSASMTLAFFLVLPVLQALTADDNDMYDIREAPQAVVDPPAPPPVDEPEPEEQEPEEPPPPKADAQPLDLAQLELALNPGFGTGLFAGDFTVDLSSVTGGPGGVEDLFGLSDLDARPRVIYNPSPTPDGKTNARAPGSVTIIFVVNEKGRVADAKVETSDHPVFESPALSAIRQWRFEPAKRNGEPVSFRLRQEFTFPKL